MESEGETGGTSMKNVRGQVCQICGDTVGITAKGEAFVACDVCAFPVYRPCYEYERKDGNQYCPQCKTRYKRLKGSPAIPGDKQEDVDTDEETTNCPFSSQTQSEKQKTAERMLSWHMTYGRGEYTNTPNYDKEVSPNYDKEVSETIRYNASYSHIF